MRSILCLIITILLSHITLADSYQYQININYGEVDSDFKEQESAGIAGTHYFSPIDDSKGPLIEAAFINRVSRISLSYNDNDTEEKLGPFIGVVPSFGVLLNEATLAPIPSTSLALVDPGFSAIKNPKSNLEEIRIDGQFHWPESGWFAYGSASDFDGEGKRLFTKQKMDGEAYSVGVGKYLFDTTTLSLGYTYLKQDNKTSFLSCAISFGGPAFCNGIAAELKNETEKETWSVSFKHLDKLAGLYYEFIADFKHTSFDVSNESLGFLDPSLQNPSNFSAAFDDIKRYSSGLTVYPLNSLGIGFTYTLSDQSDFQTDQYGISLSWFINSSLGISAHYTRIEPEISEFDSDTYLLVLTARF